MIYLDSSALVKLAHPEQWTADLVSWLDARDDEALASSALVEVEVPRALRRQAPEYLERAPGVLSRLERVDLDVNIRRRAGSYDDPLLRSLDAVHLATAQTIDEADPGGLTAFVTYDSRLTAAAAERGLPVVEPGRDGS